MNEHLNLTGVAGHVSRQRERKFSDAFVTSSLLLLVVYNNALVHSGDAFVASSFLISVVMHMSIVAMPLSLVASCY